MDNFNVIYKILKVLENAMDCMEFDFSEYSAEYFKVSDERFEKLLIMLQAEGYIKGLFVDSYLSDKGIDRIKRKNKVEITLKGLEYLHENSMMKKAASIAKGVIGTIT